MAKQQIEDAEIVQETQALIVAETDKLIQTTIGELKKATITDEAIGLLKQKYSALVVDGIEDMQGFKAVKAGAAELRKIRTSIEAKRKELTEPALRFQRELKAEADRITSELIPLEERLKAEVQRIEDAKEAKRREQYQQRITALQENGFQLINGFFVCGPFQVHSEEITNLTDAQVEVYLSNGRAELERKAAEEQRRQEEAERQRQEQERLAAERAEIEQLRRELEAEKQKVAQELAAQTAAIENTYETVVQPQQPADPTPIEFGTPVHNPAIEQLNAQPEPEPIQQSQRSIEPANEFEAGFNAFRQQLIYLVNDTNVPLSRGMLKHWAETLPYPQH